jgi:hypothetical protein
MSSLRLERAETSNQPSQLVTLAPHMGRTASPKYARYGPEHAGYGPKYVRRRVHFE